MSEHNCTKEAEISRLMTIMTGIVKEHYGNGHEGMVKTIPLLEGAIETLTTTVAAQTKVIGDLVNFQTSLNAVDKYKEKQGLSTRQRVTIIVSIILGFCSMGCTLIIKFA